MESALPGAEEINHDQDLQSRLLELSPDVLFKTAVTAIENLFGVDTSEYFINLADHYLLTPLQFEANPPSSPVPVNAIPELLRIIEADYEHYEKTNLWRPETTAPKPAGEDQYSGLLGRLIGEIGLDLDTSPDGEDVKVLRTIIDLGQHEPAVA